MENGILDVVMERKDIRDELRKEMVSVNIS